MEYCKCFFPCFKHELCSSSSISLSYLQCHLWRPHTINSLRSMWPELWMQARLLSRPRRIYMLFNRLLYRLWRRKTSQNFINRPFRTLWWWLYRFKWLWLQMPKCTSRLRLQSNLFKRHFQLPRNLRRRAHRRHRNMRRLHQTRLNRLCPRL